jgi:ankyrin repeat protein
MLLDRGLDVNAKSDQGWTPLHQAAWGGQKRAGHWSSSGQNIGTEVLLNVLLEQGADVNAATPTGEMPLHLAARTPYALNSSVSLLLNRGACVDVKSDGGWTPLHLAAQQGYEEIFYALLQGGADVEAKNLSGHTPLDLAEKSPSAVAWFERGKILERVSVMGRKLNKSNACGGNPEPRKRDMVIVSTAAPRRGEIEGLADILVVFVL